MATPRIFDPTKHLYLLPQFLDIHQACITQDFTLAVFLPPLRNDEMLRWWEARVDEVRTGTRRIIFATTSPPDGLESVVAGVVSLSMPLSETGPFRGIVEKLLISPRFRRRGVATTLMLKLEEVARAEGRPLLLLDTEKGSGAENLYPKLGYTMIGNIPNYGISPKDGRLVEEFFFTRTCGQWSRYG